MGNDILDKLSPLNLSRHLIMIDGIACVDRNFICKEYGERNFYYVMNAFYLMDWQDIEHLTIYFEERDEVVYCGLYNTNQRRKVSQRILCRQSSIYTYTEDDMLILKTNIKNP